MISEKQFIKTFTSFWQELLPISEKFVRKINLALYERFEDHIKSQTESNRRSLISEMSFEIYRSSNKLGKLIGNKFPTKKMLDDIILLSRLRISILDNKNVLDIIAPSKEEIEESIKMSINIQRYFLKYEKGGCIINPFFKGCGFIDGCNGDILLGNTLYEIKSGERKFRSVDLRQLLVYCVLNYSSHDYDIKNVGLLNPRLGIFFKINVDNFCLEQSGKASTEIFGEIIQFISGGEISI